PDGSRTPPALRSPDYASGDMRSRPIALTGRGAQFIASCARKLSMTRATRPQPRWLQTATTITSPMQIRLRHPFASGPSGRAGRPEMAARGKTQPRGKEAASLHERADLQGDRRSESAADLRRLVSSLHGLDRRQLVLQWRNHLGGTPLPPTCR